MRALPPGKAEGLREGDQGMSDQDTKEPRTIEEAAEMLIELLSEDQRELLRNWKREDLPLLHFSLGLFVRNKFRLWERQEDFVWPSGCILPDDCAEKIIERAWEKLNGL